VTEIPEHLLNRSKARRGEAAAAPAVATPGTEVAKAAPAAVAAAPKAAEVKAAVKPLPAHVVAAQTRRTVPFWALPVVVLLPLWGFIYFETMSPRAVKLKGPMAEGAIIYNSCAGCHGGAGGGGAGRQLNNGEVLKTFPKFSDQYNYIVSGSGPYVGKPYGDPAREGGQHIGKGGMPAWGDKDGKEGSLASFEIIAAVCHERFTMQNIDGASSERWKADYDKYCAPESAIYLAAEENPTTYTLKKLLEAEK
jgi:hypothetical protein